MNIRHIFVQCAYYYLLIATTAVIFLFGTTLNNIFDGSAAWQAPWFNESNQVVGLFWGLMLVDQLIGVFVVILLRRMANTLPLLSFLFLYALQFIFFILPSLVALTLAIITSTRAL